MIKIKILVYVLRILFYDKSVDLIFLRCQKVGHIAVKETSLHWQMTFSHLYI